ncbi:RNA polymerase sigma factor [Nannocystaceae bacterium ST9]
MHPASNHPLAAIARKQWPRLKRFFKSKVTEPDCYDLTQETLLAFVRADPQKVHNPEAYLWGIARKRLLGYYERKRPTEKFESARISVVELGGSLSSQLDRRRRLVAALAHLPIDQQVAFELRFGEELQLQEVADAMELSLATVKRYLSAAAIKLREVLGRPEFVDARADERMVVEAYRAD